MARLNQDLPDELLAQEVFELGDLTVAGNTVIADDVIVELTGPFRSKKSVTALEVTQLVGKIREIYADTGYALIVVHRPLYGLVDGKVHVRIEIVEGHIDEVTWSSDRVGKARQEHWAQKLIAEKPLKTDTRYRYESLAKELPGIEVNGTLASGKEVGATRIEFNDTLKKKAEYSLSLNNRGTESSGPYQFTLGGIWMRPTGGNDRLRLSYSGTTDWGEQHYLYGQYDRWVGNEGAILSVFGSWNNGDPGTEVLDRLEYLSQGYTFGAKLTYPMVIKQELDLRLFASLEHGDYRSEILGSPNTHDRLTFVTAGATARWSDQWIGETSGGHDLTVTFHQGIPGLGSFGNDNSFASRGDGRVDFSKISFDWQRGQTFTDKWIVKLSAQGQKAFNPLLSSQECGFGGARFGRAYDSSALIGDDCLMGGVEIARKFESKSKHLKNVQLFGFGDIGKVWQHGGDSNEAASIGLGVRGAIGKYTDFEVEGARQIRFDNTDEKWRAFFNLGAKW